MQMWRHEASKRTEAVASLAPPVDCRKRLTRGSRTEFPQSAQRGGLRAHHGLARRDSCRARGAGSRAGRARPRTPTAKAPSGAPRCCTRRPSVSSRTGSSGARQNPNKGASRSGIYRRARKFRRQLRMAVALRPASSRLMLNWLGHVQRAAAVSAETQRPDYSCFSAT